MEKCPLCSSVKAQFECGLCKKVVCKSCVERFDQDLFSYLSAAPQKLKHENYCSPCFDQEVASEKLRCEELLAAAENVFFLTNNYRGFVRIFLKHTKRVEVKACPDRRECILRLAFFAAELGFNAIIDSDIVSKKIKNGKYQTTTWSGSAIPANIDGANLEARSLKGF